MNSLFCSSGDELAASQVVNFYLDDDRKVERTAIIDICQEHNATGDDLLAGYVREALRQ
jgi:linoleate 10R-lipoxygenase